MGLLAGGICPADLGGLAVCLPARPIAWGREGNECLELCEKPLF